MFKPLLRTLPSLTGNFKFACRITDLVKENNNSYKAYCRSASFMPLQENLYSRDIPCNLLHGLYEFDIVQYYRDNIDVFYNENFSFLDYDFQKLDILKQNNFTRNKNYEMGCSRCNVFNTGYQFCFYAPFYIDDLNDLPDYFEITIQLHKNLTKKLKIQINENVGISDIIKPDYKNHLYRYLERYCSKLDAKVLFYNEDKNQFIYNAIDVNNGGIVTLMDSYNSVLTKEVLTINGFDKHLNKGFEMNKLIMKQIIPIAFMFNINDLLTDIEKHVFNFYKIKQISGRYFKDNKAVDFFDFNINYDYLSINDYNIMNRLDKLSLKEQYLKIYKYDNKITPYYSRWKMTLSGGYNDIDNLYHTNLNYKFDSSDNTYGLFPNINNIKNLSLSVSSDESDINTTCVTLDYYQTQPDDTNNNYIIYNENMKLYKWFSLYNFDNLTVDFYNPKSWGWCLNNYSYYNGILYNLQNYVKGDVNIDYFNIFLIPNINIITNDNEEIIKVKYTFTNKNNSNETADVYINFNGVNDNTVNITSVRSEEPTAVVEKDILFKKWDPIEDKDQIAYILNNEINNNYIKYEDLDYYFNVKRNKFLNISRNTISKYLRENENKNNNYTEEGYYKVENIHYKSNLTGIKYKINNESNSEYPYEKFYVIGYDNKMHEYSEYYKNIPDDAEITVYKKSHFYAESIVKDILYTVLNLKTWKWDKKDKEKIEKRITKVLKFITRYTYNFYNTNIDEKIFTVKKKKYHRIYIDAYNIYDSILDDLNNFKRYYANVKTYDSINLFYSKIFNKHLNTFNFITPIINNDNKVKFKKYSFNSSDFKSGSSKKIFEDIIDNNIMLYNYNNQQFSGKLYKTILGKYISKFEINNILNNTYAYYMYIKEDKFEDGSYKYMYTNKSTKGKFKYLKRSAKYKFLKPIFNDCLYLYNNKDENIFQRNLIVSGKICLRNKKTGETKKITSNNVDNIKRHEIVYYDNIEDKYEYMFEYNSNFILNNIEKNLLGSPYNIQNMSVFEFLYFLINSLYSTNYEYIKLSNYETDSLIKIIINDDGHKTYNININIIKQYINNLLDIVKQMPELFDNYDEEEVSRDITLNILLDLQYKESIEFENENNLKLKLDDIQLKLYDIIFNIMNVNIKGIFLKHQETEYDITYTIDKYDENENLKKLDDIKIILSEKPDSNTIEILEGLLDYLYNTYYDLFVNIINNHFTKQLYVKYNSNKIDICKFDVQNINIANTTIEEMNTEVSDDDIVENIYINSSLTDEELNKIYKQFNSDDIKNIIYENLYNKINIDLDNNTYNTLFYLINVLYNKNIEYTEINDDDFYKPVSTNLYVLNYKKILNKIDLILSDFYSCPNIFNSLFYKLNISYILTEFMDVYSSLISDKSNDEIHELIVNYINYLYNIQSDSSNEVLDYIYNLCFELYKILKNTYVNIRLIRSNFKIITDKIYTYIFRNISIIPLYNMFIKENEDEENTDIKISETVNIKFIKDLVNYLYTYENNRLFNIYKYFKENLIKYYNSQKITQVSFNFINNSYQKIRDINMINHIYIDITNKQIYHDDYINVIQNDNNLFIFEYDNKKYCCLFIEKYFENTDNIFYIDNINRFNKFKLNKTDNIIRTCSKTTFYKYLNYFMPYLKNNLFNLFNECLITNNMYDIIIYPSKFNLESYYYTRELDNKNYANSYYDSLNLPIYNNLEDESFYRKQIFSSQFIIKKNKTEDKKIEENINSNYFTPYNLSNIIYYRKENNQYIEINIKNLKNYKDNIILYNENGTKEYIPSNDFFKRAYFIQDYNMVYDLYKSKKLLNNIYLYRYINYISPIMSVVPVDGIYQYELKYKNNDKIFGNDNIYKILIDINKYPGIYSFTNENNSKINQGKYKIIKEYEYKHYNDNSYFILKSYFEIQINKYLSYEELLEYETEKITLEYFKEYIKKFNEDLLEDDNNILFLFNKYSVSYDSNSVKLTFQSDEKLYLLKYIFKLI